MRKKVFFILVGIVFSLTGYGQEAEKQCVRSQQRNAFWGYPVVTGNLYNFGGRINLHGDLRLLTSNQYLSACENSPNISGTGLFMEGIEQNPVYHEFAFEMQSTFK